MRVDIIIINAGEGQIAFKNPPGVDVKDVFGFCGCLGFKNPPGVDVGEVFVS